MSLQQWLAAQDSPEVPVNENFKALEHMAVYAKDATTTTGLTWGYLGGRWGGFAVVAGTLALAASSTLYITVSRTTGAISVSSSDASWTNPDAHARVYKLTTGAATVTAAEDHRAGFAGVHGVSSNSSGSGGQSSSVTFFEVAQISSGVLDLSSEAVGAYLVSMNSNVIELLLPIALPGTVLSLLIVFTQDAVGGRTVDGWPPITWESGAAPSISASPGSVTSIPLLIFGNGLILGVN